jgi:predicted outer membrane repeat protein
MRYMHSGWAPVRHQARLAVFVALCLSLTLVAVDPSAAAAACKVTNAARGGTYKSLGAAVKAARNGNTLAVRGTCLGSTQVSNKRLTVVGKWSRDYGVPTLRGNGRETVLTVGGDSARVTVEKLTIRAKPDRVLRRGGGGISNVIATLVLRDVTVKGFKTREGGGGIANVEGTVRLLGTTKVVNNESTERGGGGVYNNSGTVMLGDRALVANNTARAGGGIDSVGSSAVLVLKGTSSVRGNTATGYGGGGILADHGRVTLSGDASISGNTTSQYGGGYAGSGVLTMAGDASISDNSAETGGGVYSGGDIVMTTTNSVTGNTAIGYAGGVDHSYGSRSGVVCYPEPDANVFGNSPGDCNLD